MDTSSPGSRCCERCRLVATDAACRACTARTFAYDDAPARWFRRGTLTSVPAPIHSAAPRVTDRIVGSARVLSLTLARATIAGANDVVQAWTVQSEDFILEREDILVTGVLRLEGAGIPVPPDALGPWSRHVRRDRVREIVLVHGDEVEVFGTPRDEQRSDGYRDRSVRVMRGTADEPVCVRRRSG